MGIYKTISEKVNQKNQAEGVSTTLLTQKIYLSSKKLIVELLQAS